MDEVARVLVLVAQDRRRWIERTEPIHSGPAQDSAHGGTAEMHLLCDPPAVEAQSAKSKNLFYERR